MLVLCSATKVIVYIQLNITILMFLSLLCLVGVWSLIARMFSLGLLVFSVHSSSRDPRVISRRTIRFNDIDLPSEARSE